MAIWSVAFVGSRPVASALNVAIADAASPILAFIGTHCRGGCCRLVGVPIREHSGRGAFWRQRLNLRAPRQGQTMMGNPDLSEVKQELLLNEPPSQNAARS